jgi:hypothetical protein
MSVKTGIQKGSRPKLDTADACRYMREEHGLKRTPGTMAKYRSVGGGPRFYPGAGRPQYDPDDLDEWVLEQLGSPVTSTAEYPKDETRKPRGRPPINKVGHAGIPDAA